MKLKTIISLRGDSRKYTTTIEGLNYRFEMSFSCDYSMLDSAVKERVLSDCRLFLSDEMFGSVKVCMREYKTEYAKE